MPISTLPLTGDFSAVVLFMEINWICKNALFKTSPNYVNASNHHYGETFMGVLAPAACYMLEQITT